MRRFLCKRPVLTASATAIAITAIAWAFWMTVPRRDEPKTLAYPPSWCVVQVTSHGGSAVVIHSDDERTYLLCSADQFGTDNKPTEPITLDYCNDQVPFVAGLSHTEIVKIDRQQNLCLLRTHYGRVPFVAAVAPPGHRYRTMVACGYDGMKRPEGNGSFARQSNNFGGGRGYAMVGVSGERGQEGGGVMDPDGGYLMGVIFGHKKGWTMFKDHDDVMRFLGGQGYAWLISGTNGAYADGLPPAKYDPQAAKGSGGWPDPQTFHGFVAGVALWLFFWWMIFFPWSLFASLIPVCIFFYVIDRGWRSPIIPKR